MNEFQWLLPVGVALVGIAFIMFGWEYPRRQVLALSRLLSEKDENKKPDELELAKLENENRRTFMQMLVQLLAVLTLAGGAYQWILNRGAAEVAEAERDAKIRASGLELLGKGTTPWERLAGIIILREWAKVDPNHDKTDKQKDPETREQKRRREFLTPLLINFVRARTSTFKPSSLNCGLASNQWAPFLPKKEPGHSVDPDVQGALDYLRNDHPEIEDLNFRELDLTNADLSGLRAKNAVFAYTSGPKC